MNEIPCSACNGGKWRIYCHECKGLGYIELPPPKCSQNPPECPIEYEIMCGGWLCTKCGQSGPL